MKNLLLRRIASLLLTLLFLLGWSGAYSIPAISAEQYSKISPTVDMGYDFVVALDSKGQAYAWGENTHGTLGNGDKTDCSTPVAVSMPQGVAFGRISAGRDHVLALGTDKKVYAWGANNNQQLGKSSPEDQTTPQLVEGLPAEKTFVSVAAGACFSMALSSDGMVYAWGLNDKGQLGISPDTVTSSFIPAPIVTLEGIFATEIFSGESMAAIISADGTLWLWGDNADGQIDHNGERYALPCEKTSAKTYFAASVAIGARHVTLVELNGSVKSFGLNLYGQFGNGSEPSDELYAAMKSASLPQDVSIRAISVGLRHTVALGSNGSVYTWGENHAQQLGYAVEASHQLTPRKVEIPAEGDPQAVWMQAYGNTTVILDQDGFLWTFGENTNGQLGNGSLVSSVTPVSVLGVGGNGRLCLGKGDRREIYQASITAVASIPAPTYTVTIPSTLSVGALRQKEADDPTRISSTEFALSVSNLENLFGEKKIAVDITPSGGSFELHDKEHRLAYAIYREESETPLSPGDRFAEFTSAGTKKGSVRIDQSTITRKGNYEGTLFFIFSVIPANAVEE